MTDDEIRNMPAGREMDAFVAEKVMGQPAGAHLLAVWMEGSTPDGTDGWSGFACPRCNTPQDMYDRPCARYYSTDIAAAWEVVKEMSAKNFWAHLHMLSSVTKCSFGINREDGLYQVEAEAEINEMPLAVCRAALLAVNDG